MPHYATTATYRAVGRPNPALDIPAVQRCCEEWRRVYRSAYRGDHDEWRASDRAGDAFCAALPPLTSRQNCRDFIACIAYGIMIKAIAEKDGGKLLYAAQVALSSFANERKTQKSPDSATNRPKTGANSRQKP